MQNWTYNLSYRCWAEVEAVLLSIEMFCILNKETQETSNFHIFHSTKLMWDGATQTK